MKQALSKGFTLIEILVVIAVIGVLTALILPNLVGARERARDASLKKTMREFQTAMRLYYNDNQVYPASLANAVAQTGSGSPYMKESLNGVVDFYSNPDGTTNSFAACATLENAADIDITDSRTSCGLSGNSSTAGMFCVCSF